MNPNDQALRLYALTKLKSFRISVWLTQRKLRRQLGPIDYGLSERVRALSLVLKKAEAKKHQALKRVEVKRRHRYRVLACKESNVVKLEVPCLPRDFEGMFHRAITQAVIDALQGRDTEPNWTSIRAAMDWEKQLREPLLRAVRVIKVVRSKKAKSKKAIKAKEAFNAVTAITAIKAIKAIRAKKSFNAIKAKKAKRSLNVIIERIAMRATLDELKKNMAKTIEDVQIKDLSVTKQYKREDIEAAKLVLYLQHAWPLLSRYFPAERWGFPSEHLVQQLLELLVGEKMTPQAVVPSVVVTTDVHGLYNSFVANKYADGQDDEEMVRSLMILNKLLQESPIALIRIEPAHYQTREHKKSSQRSAEESLGHYYREAKKELEEYNRVEPPHRYEAYTEIIDDCLPLLNNGDPLKDILRIRAEQKLLRKQLEWERKYGGHVAKSNFSKTPPKPERKDMRVRGIERKREIEMLKDTLARTGLQEQFAHLLYSK